MDCAAELDLVHKRLVCVLLEYLDRCAGGESRVIEDRMSGELCEILLRHGDRIIEHILLALRRFWHSVPKEYHSYLRNGGEVVRLPTLMMKMFTCRAGPKGPRDVGLREACVRCVSDTFTVELLHPECARKYVITFANKNNIWSRIRVVARSMGYVYGRTELYSL